MALGTMLKAAGYVCGDEIMHKHVNDYNRFVRFSHRYYGRNAPIFKYDGYELYLLAKIYLGELK